MHPDERAHLDGVIYDIAFAAVAVLMLSDLGSASENLPGQNLEEVKRSWFPEDYKRASWYPLFHKGSEHEQTPDFADSQRAKRYYFYY
uniref:Uncharacterized protein n=1 Tax=Trichogramma kaykai TaxID=54128 RepID=A0ABD2VUF6_9HYME